ncbi:MAG: hypothetical protein JWQ24_4967, partial [Tardiphaga sp.]|nr:hypothetical protein [Tardiphaga sp.]
MAPTDTPSLVIRPPLLVLDQVSKNFRVAGGGTFAAVKAVSL